MLHCVAACCNVFTVAPAPTCMCVYEEEYTHVAVCCSVLQCVAVWCCVLQCVAVCCSVFTVAPAPPVCVHMRRNSRMLQCVAVCCSVRQCFTPTFLCVYAEVFTCVAVYCSLLQGVAVCSLERALYFSKGVLSIIAHQRAYMNTRSISIHI